MHIKRFNYIVLILSMLACNFVTSQFSPPPTPTVTPPPTYTSTPTPLAPSYIPEICKNTALATISPEIALAQPTPELAINPEITKSQQKEVFNKIVDTFQKVYVYPDFNGKDWNAITENYRAQINAGLTTEEFYIAMQTMINELGDEHSHIESPVQVSESEADLAGSNEFVGVGVYVLPQVEKKKASIILVFPGSPAELSGLQAHDSILAVDGIPVVQDEQSFIFLARGPECSATVFTVQSPDEAPRDVMLVRQKIQSPLVIDARLVPTSDGSRIGYIFLPTFFDRTIPEQVEQALKDFGPLDGLILDNRLNSGGSSDVVEPILSFFASGKLGEFVSRTEARSLQIFGDEIANSQEVPLVILVSEETVSFGEVFSGVLQDAGRAKIVGQTSLGNVEVLHGYELPYGSRLWVAEETFHSAFSNSNWEATGIIPDLEAVADWDTFTFETDPAITAALTLLGHTR
jgi:carboxyl-terminal processing protease